MNAFPEVENVLGIEVVFIISNVLLAIELGVFFYF